MTAFSLDGGGPRDGRFALGVWGEKRRGHIEVGSSLEWTPSDRGPLGQRLVPERVRVE